MKFFCLAYGDARDWSALSKEKQDELLKQDEVLRKRGALMAAVKPSVTTVSAWDGSPNVRDSRFAISDLPLAGFSVIEADSLEEVIQLVSGTPCARAKGAIEIRAITAINDDIITAR
jgi:hypothetical protein